MQAMAIGLLPQNAGATATAVAVLADELAFLSGDRSTDLAWYGKRGLIGGVYASTGENSNSNTTYYTAEEIRWLYPPLGIVVWQPVFRTLTISRGSIQNPRDLQLCDSRVPCCQNCSMYIAAVFKACA